MIVFTIMDYDMLFRNEFGGEAYLPFREVPGVIADNDKLGFQGLKCITLPVHHIKLGNFIFIKSYSGIKF